MRTLLRWTAPLLLSLAVVVPAAAQAPPAAHQIAGAVTPAPPDLQASATVLGYDDDGRLVRLREGTGSLVCLADDPSDDRFHAACYHASLEPFMARGRTLRAEGKSREEVQAIREREAENGTLEMPDDPAMLYQYFGPADAFDPATGAVKDVRRLTVVYMPWATAESTGLPTNAPAGSPWIMNPGKPWAHIMLMEPEGP